MKKMEEKNWTYKVGIETMFFSDPIKCVKIYNGEGHCVCVLYGEEAEARAALMCGNVTQAKDMVILKAQKQELLLALAEMADKVEECLNQTVDYHSEFAHIESAVKAAREVLTKYQEQA
jgi:hypothetical protein